MTEPDAWTVGDSEIYGPALAERAAAGEPLMKLGRTLDYEGGSVWRTLEAAREYLARTGCPYSVYGLSLPGPWDEVVDSSREPEVGYGSLLQSAEILGPAPDPPFYASTESSPA